MRGFIIGVAAALGLFGSAAGQCTSCVSGSGWVRVVRIPSAVGIPGAGTPQNLFCTAAGADFTINLAAYSWNRRVAPNVSWCEYVPPIAGSPGDR